ncbi:MAG: ABC transporter ATP-binding protein [Actinomycetota bacterium]
MSPTLAARNATDELAASPDSEALERSEPSVWSVIAPVGREIRLGMVVSVVGLAVWLGSIMMFLPIVGELVADDRDSQRLVTLLAMSFGLVVVSLVCRTIAFRISHLAAFRLEQVLRTELTTHLAKVPYGKVLSAGSGAIKKVIVDDVRALHVFVADSTPTYARVFAAPLVTIVLMFVLDWRLALVSLVVLFVGLVAMSFAFRDADTVRRELDDANERVSGVINEYVQGMQVVRTFDDGSGSFERYRTALREMTEVLREWTGRSRFGGYVAKTVFAALPMVITLIVVGVPMYRNGSIDLQTLVVMLMLAPTLTESMVPIVWLQQAIVDAAASVKRIERWRAVEVLPEVTVGVAPLDASVELRNVTFRYEGRRDDALTGVSLQAPAGTVTALVGPSGSGKSTAAQLLLRFWDPDDGQVLIGGVDLRDMTSEQLSRTVGFVFQTPFLLADTITNNIRLARPDASDDDVERAARAAHAHDFIVDELPDGYDTVVGERGASLSGGQRQRITIARTILQDAPVIVLDEATAFADPDNEAKIHLALAALAQGKTLIVVAHRLSTVRDAHQIVVLDDGRVSESGTHAELVAAGGRYARLWSSFNRARDWGVRTHGDGPSDRSTTTARG